MVRHTEKGLRFGTISFAAAVAVMSLVVATAHAQSEDQLRQLTVTAAQMAGGTARIAADICQIDPGLVAAYKERARKAFAADANFEGNWIVGWNGRQREIDDIMKLKVGNPVDYALRKTEICVRINIEMSP